MVETTETGRPQSPLSVNDDDDNNIHSDSDSDHHLYEKPFEITQSMLLTICATFLGIAISRTYSHVKTKH